MTASTPRGRSGNDEPRLGKLLANARERLADCRRPEPERWLLVDVRGQRLHLVAKDHIIYSCRISTAANGIDGRDDSLGTPEGVHLIDTKIGEGAPIGAVFVSRIATGEIWPDKLVKVDSEQDDFVLTRVLTLAGCEDGINRGPGCDSKSRFIYLHGTNQEERIGTPASHGCVRLRNEDIVALFERVEEGDAVVIL